MRSPRITLCALLAACALAVLPAPAAGAAPAEEDPDTMAGSVWVSPSAVAPGSDVALRVSGCEGRVGTARSEVFVDEVPLARVAEGLIGDATVSSSAEPGSYAVSVDCDGSEAMAEGTVKVLPAAATASPSAPVQAGGGAMAARQAPAPSAGQRADADRGPAAGTTGAFGLVLAGGAALIIAGRVRRRRGRGGDGAR